MQAAGLSGSGSTHAARRAREEWRAAQRREIDTAVRGRARVERERQEWDAEVAQYGEEEASRRRREEREWRRIQDDLPTSEIDAMEAEDKIDNSMLNISAVHDD